MKVTIKNDSIAAILTLLLGLLPPTVISLQAQVVDPGTLQAEPVPGVGHDYIGMGAETVNPLDGSVTFNLPIQTPEGRELQFPFSIRFNSTEPFYLLGSQSSPSFGWTIPIQQMMPLPFSLNGWSYSLPFY